MQPGKLRHRIRIQHKPQAQDEWGEPLDVWENLIINVPAAIEPASGTEFFSAQQVQANATHKITMRWRAWPVITPMMRVVHQTSLQASVSPPESTIYDIQSVIADDTGRREIVLTCVVRTNEGFRSGVRT